MKILFITNLPAPYRVSFFNELSKYAEVEVFFENRNGDDRNEEWLKISNCSFKYTFSCDNKTNLSNLKNKILKKSFDKIIIGNYSTNIERNLIRFFKLNRILYWISSDGGFKKKDFFLKYLIKKYYISGAYGYFSSSKLTDEYLIKYGAKRNKIYRYQFTSIKADDIEYCYKKNKKTNEFVILGVGQIINRKGWDLLIEATKNLKNVKIIIVGGGMSSQLKTLIENNQQKNIEFIDFVDKNKIKEYYKIADVFVLPTREDIWGLVVNEAASKGLPVITTNKCNAGLEILDNKSGFILSINDEKKFIYDLYNLLKMLIINKEILDEYSLNIFKRVKYYTIENMAKKYFEILTNN